MPNKSVSRISYFSFDGKMLLEYTNLCLSDKYDRRKYKLNYLLEEIKLRDLMSKKH